MIVSEGLNNEHIMSAYSYGSLENICIKRKRKQKNQLFSLSNLTKIFEYTTSRHQKQWPEAFSLQTSISGEASRAPLPLSVSTELYEYKGLGEKSANPKHRCFTWGSRYSEVSLFNSSLMLCVYYWLSVPFSSLMNRRLRQKKKGVKNVTAILHV